MQYSILLMISVTKRGMERSWDEGITGREGRNWGDDVVKGGGDRRQKNDGYETGKRGEEVTLTTSGQDEFFMFYSSSSGREIYWHRFESSYLSLFFCADIKKEDRYCWTTISHKTSFFFYGCLMRVLVTW